MHKIHSIVFELDDFSHEHLTAAAEKCLMQTIHLMNSIAMTIVSLKGIGDKSGDTKFGLVQMISFFQTSTISAEPFK
jgi:hypothetical protein